MKDKRFKKTEYALKAALTDLLKEKSISNISVVELCTAAEINKSTFYLHYRDIYEYFNVITDEVAKKIADVYNIRSYEELLTRYTDMFMEGMNIINDDELAKVLIGGADNNTLVFKVTDLISSAIVPKVTDDENAALMTKIKCRFVVFGTFGVIREYSDEIFSNPSLVKMLGESIQNGFIGRN